MESNSPLHPEQTKSRDPAVRRAMTILIATFGFLLLGLIVVNGVVAHRIHRIVKHGGLVRSWSDYVGYRASYIFGYRFHQFYEDNYVIRDQYEVYFGDLERAYVGCGTGITFGDAPTDPGDRHQDPGDLGPVLIRELGHVYKVSFAQTAVSDAGLAPLKGLTTIGSLDLSGTNVQGPGLSNLQGMPLWNLSLQSTPLDDAGLAQLPDFPELRDLSLGETRITPAFVKQLRRFPKLAYLNLSGLPITDDVVKEISSLPLENLDLSNTNITHASIPYLEGMSNLRYLMLCGTKITKDEAANSTKGAVNGWAISSSLLCPFVEKTP